MLNEAARFLRPLKRKLIPLMSFYPPFLGAGVRVLRCSQDFREIEVSMKLYSWNRNYVGTHFGGSLFSMCDPFFMLMLIENLGPDYIVWDKSASIEFKRPGRGSVKALFKLTDSDLNLVHRQIEVEGRALPEFIVKVTDLNDQVIAIVRKQISVKKKV